MFDKQSRIIDARAPCFLDLCVHQPMPLEAFACFTPQVVMRELLHSASSVSNVSLRCSIRPFTVCDVNLGAIPEQQLLGGTPEKYRSFSPKGEPLPLFLLGTVLRSEYQTHGTARPDESVSRVAPVFGMGLAEGWGKPGVAGGLERNAPVSIQTLSLLSCSKQTF